MAGERSGLSTLICDKVREEAGNATKLPCIIQQHDLCAKHLKCDDVMKPAAKANNSIRSKALLSEKGQPMEELSNPVWLAYLAFLVDITKHLNGNLVRKMQGWANYTLTLRPINSYATALFLQNSMQCDDECRGKHQQCSLVDFYRQMEKSRIPEMRLLAKKILSLFGSTYVWANVHELKQEPHEVKGEWLPLAWHFTHLNHCSQAGPGLFTQI